MKVFALPYCILPYHVWFLCLGSLLLSEEKQRERVDLGERGGTWELGGEERGKTVNEEYYLREKDII